MMFATSAGKPGPTGWREHYLALIDPTLGPVKNAELRREILTFLEPLRRKLFGDPDVVLATTYFVRISPARAGQNVFPSATSTNVDGTTACVLSATQISLLRQRIQTPKARISSPHRG